MSHDQERSEQFSIMDWITTATVEVRLPTDSSREDELEKDYLQCLSQQLQRQRPKEVSVCDANLTFRGPIRPWWRWPLQLWGVPCAEFTVVSRRDALLVRCEAELSGPFFGFGIALAAGAFFVWRLSALAALENPLDWLMAGAAALLFATVVAAASRALAVVAVEYQIRQAASAANLM